MTPGPVETIEELERRMYEHQHTFMRPTDAAQRSTQIANDAIALCRSLQQQLAVGVVEADELQARYDAAMKVVEPNSFWQRHGSITKDAITAVRDLQRRLNGRDDILKAHEQQLAALQQQLAEQTRTGDIALQAALKTGLQYAEQLAAKSAEAARMREAIVSMEGCGICSVCSIHNEALTTAEGRT